MKLWKMLLMLFIAVSLFVGCGGDDSSDDSSNDPSGGQLISVEAIDEFENYEALEIYLNSLDGETNTMTSSLGSYDTMDYAIAEGNMLAMDWTQIMAVLKTLMIDTGLWRYLDPAVGVERNKVTFKRDGTKTPETGLLVRRYRAGYFHDPIVILNHPTDTLRKNSPSFHVNEHDGWLDGTGSKIVALWLAYMGFTVILPDYPGMGDNYEVHPYCLASLGKSDAGMLDAVRQIKGFKESGNIYLLGYSEGGYVTLAAAKYMRNFPAKYMIKGVASLAGPHDLQGTMRNLMLSADQTYPTPYFLPYTIEGYSGGYPDVIEFKFDKAVVSTPVIENKPFYERLTALLTGNDTGVVISNLMETVENYSGPLSITTDIFTTALKENESTVNQKLTENTLPGKFTPITATQYLFAHYRNDDCVPVGNILAVQVAWKGYTGNVEFDIFDSTDPFTKEDLGTTHAAALPQAYVRSFKFILKQEGRW